MIDIHSHILFMIDDGSKSLEESINIIKKAYENGVTDIVVTPHYIEGSKYIADNEVKKKILNNIKENIKDIDINLYLGNEVMITPDMLKLIEEDKISVINDTKYILFELPMNDSPNYLEDLIFKLKSAGYTPIIAHPERYMMIKEDYTKVFKWIELGALLQSNLGSLYGRYGNESKKTINKLLSCHAISFLSSDIHHDVQTVYNRIPELKKELEKKYGITYTNELLHDNAYKVLNNEDVLVEVTKPKKSIFFWKK